MAKGSKTVKAPSSSSNMMDQLRKLGRRARQINPFGKSGRAVGSALGDKLLSGDYLKDNKRKK